ncbi:unnamed protein product [Arabidopsis thaliana]|uniref:Protein TIFY n=1 Tax=Arabidopsis thaliana TaxID=3702 RepID=A0A7G2E3R7_ARATH|nr:unnamed protein product [Arabidopsis thaliana]
MERDFLGLSDKQYLSNNVKHEVNDDAVEERGLSTKAAREWGKSKVFATSSFMPSSDFQWGSVSAANVFRRCQFGGAFQNATPLLLGGSVPLPTHPSLVPRVASSGSSPQLTIFYGGTISVFNDISPDKAQAIMLCAGNGLKGETGDSKPVREAERMCRDTPVAATNAMSMIESFNAAPRNMIPSVPQARKASLARFLEKRKERLMSAMPYKKMLLDLSTGESSGMNYSSTSPT